MANNNSKVGSTFTLNASNLVSNLNKVAQAFKGVGKAAQSSVPNASKSVGILKATMATLSLSMEAMKNGAGKAFGSVVVGTQQMSNALNGLRNMGTNLVDSFRQVTQGLLSMGRALTFFIALPLTAFLKGAIQQSIDYEKALFRIAKVAGFEAGADGMVKSGKAYKELDGYIRDITSVSISGHEQFTTWAEQLGSFGVENVNSMKAMLPILEMFTQGTDVSTETVVADVGKIANQFGFAMAEINGDTKDTTDFLWRFVNTVNKLENVTGATASQIMGAVADAGPMLDTLGVPSYIVASWAALGVEAGLTTGEVGTGLRNMGIMLAKNLDKFDASPIMKSIFGDRTQFKQSLTDDFAGTFNKMVAGFSAAGATKPIDALDEAYQFFGMRADKLFSALTKQWELSADTAGKSAEEISNRFTDIMTVAAKQFEAPDSLAQEYEMMTQSASASLSMLKNNIQNLGLTVGDALLPPLVEATKAITPLVKAFSNVFASLSKGAKNTIFAVVGITAVAGPLLFFFSQIAFGASLVAEGLMKFGVVAGQAIKFFGVMGIQMAKLNPVAWGMAAGITAAFISLKGNMVSVVGFITDTLAKLLRSMSGWGGGIFSALADGIQSAESTIYTSITNIANLIAGFFESHSPPKQGPLQHIDKWGTTLFDTYLDGFMKADFGILTDVGNVVEHIFKSWESIGKISGEGVADQMFMQFRQDFAGLLASFNATGNIDVSAINALTASLGEESDEISKLIELNLKLKRIELDLIDIDKKKTQAKDTFRAEVRDLVTSNMTLEDRVSILRQAAKERDTELMILDEQEQITEKKKTDAQEALDLQKSMLDAYKDQDNIQMSIIDALNKLKTGLGSLGDDISRSISKSLGVIGGGGTSAFDQFSVKISEIKVQAYELEVLLKGVFENVVRAIQGKPILAVDALKESLFGIAGKPVEDVTALIDKFQDLGRTILESTPGIDTNTTSTENMLIVAKKLARVYNKGDIKKLYELMGQPDTAIKVSEQNAQIQGLYGAIKKLGLEQDVIDTMLGPNSVLMTDATIPWESAFSRTVGVGGEFSKILTVISEAMADVREQGSKLGKALVDSFSAGFSGTGDATYMTDDTLTGMERMISIVGEIAGVLIKHAPTIIDLVGRLALAIFNAFTKIDGGTQSEKSIGQRIDGLLTSLEKFTTWLMEHEGWLKALVVTVGISKFVLAPIASTAFSIFGKDLLGAIWKGLKGIAGATSTGTSISAAAGTVGVLALPVTLAIIFTAIAIDRKNNPEKYIEQDLKNAEIQMQYAQKWSGMAGWYGAGAAEAGTKAGITFTEAMAMPIDRWASEFKFDQAGLMPIDKWATDFAEKTGSFSVLAQQAKADVESIFTVDPNLVKQWADLFNMSSSDWLSAAQNGTLKLAEVIKVTIPSLQFENLDAEVTKLTGSLVTAIETALNSANVTAVDNTALMTALTGIIQKAIQPAFSDSTVLSAAAMSLIASLSTAFSSEDNVQGLMDIGKKMAGTVAAGINAFLTGSGLVDASGNSVAGGLLTPITEATDALAGIATNVTTAFSGAFQAMNSIIELIAGSTWTGFISTVKLMGGENGTLTSPFMELNSFIIESLMPTLSGLNGTFDTMIGKLQTIVDKIAYILKNGNLAYGMGGTRTGNQTGGSMFGGQMSTVGETGVELFSAPVNGHITSHSLLTSMMSQASSQGSSNGNKYNMTVVGSPVQMTEEELMRTARKMELLYG